MKRISFALCGILLSGACWAQGLGNGSGLSITGSGSGGGSLVGGTTPITGVCPNGQLLYNNAGILGCQAAAAASISIGSPITSSTAGFGLYVNGSNQLGQFAFGTNVFAALGNPINAASGLVGYSGALGTPTSGVATNLTGYPASALAAGAIPSGATINNANWSGTGLAYANLASISANTILGALTATTPSGLAVPSCSGASNALIWTSGTGFGCNTISGSGSPGGSSGQIQYNNAGAFGGTATGTGVLTALGSALNGTGALVGATSPTITTATLSGNTITNSITLQSSGDYIRFNNTLTFITSVGAYPNGGVEIESNSGNADLFADATNLLTLHNGTSPNAFRVYNTYTDASNGEWAAFEWQTASNVLTIGAKANGTGTSRGVNFVGASVAINGTATVSCAAASVSLVTLVVTNGFVTHC